tara:strand:- start:399 stop:866 length:468 start_codon:yes stop_codon:yes gene_type:complete
MSSSDLKIDLIDRRILEHLASDSRKTYNEIASDLKLATATIHSRVARLRQSGVIKGSHVDLDFQKLGFLVTSFIGVNLASAKGVSPVVEKLKSFQEVTSVHYTTGQYSLFVKVVTKTTQDLHLFLINKLQTLDEISSTETFISLDNPIERSRSLG